MKDKKSLLVKIFDTFAEPFASKRTLTSIETVLVTEESKSEIVISRFRVILSGLALIYMMINRTNILPFLLYFIFSAALTFKLSLIHSSEIYRQKYFLSWVKYMLILYDTIFFTWLIYSINSHNTFDPWLLTALYGIFGAVMILTDIFRYDFYSSIFCGVIIIISRWILTLWNSHLTFSPLRSPDNILVVSLILFTLLSCLISTNFRNVILKSIKQKSLERYVPDLLAKELIDKGEDLTFKGDRSPVTILFSDIRNFTTFSEQVPPEEVIHFLNDYFSTMIDIIFKNNGMLDKIMGDGLMAIYGSPFTLDSNPELDAINAVKTAIEMKAHLDVFNQLITSKGYKPISIGIGINTGYAVLGSIGTDKRREFTAIGDTVNTASRLESHTKEVDTNILISEATKKHLGPEFDIETIGTISLKGKSEEIKAFKVL